ncbi:MAG TPA: secondary thiamine-phosphate synthase enzyme YjbQ [Candidatus Polarisedimenticolia bacterium]|jgi:secondary thiamine-phosphate synthase enzyme|nr:secondary thiamine-phosphate synthase enzyme YjbQ [Candidatus Polarisedimenticolia bacterium]
MKIANASIAVKSPSRTAIVNVTAGARTELARAGLRHGLALITVPHTTCGLCVNEDETGLRDDLVRLASRLVDLVRPEEGFRHDAVDDNARAHLSAVLFGHSVTLPVVEGSLVLGTWQSLFLIEIDGPRTRRLDLAFLGE